jgi:hypothetical protein
MKSYCFLKQLVHIVTTRFYRVNHKCDGEQLKYYVELISTVDV